ncbi:uncharacterized protein LOC122669547 isoform X2 [Telopea speciosissima]|uniref:uncharacterized protein LOC122669547 isoform X2 n=1 Tax=Telopea speciosissima TaxID=54955 RepID=UPI001CC78712|nr:uncharacterized protein LOC122669547 isoform X2 [Telopea speciosissima]
MEMDSAELNKELEAIEETPVDLSLEPASPEISSIFGEPQVFPRIGDQYQVEIPLLIKESDCLQLKKKRSDAEDMVDVSQSFLVGLPIPIMWVHDGVTNIKCESLECLSDPDDTMNRNGLVESESNKENQVVSNNGDLKRESLDFAPKYGKGLEPSASLEFTVVSRQIDVFPMLQEKKPNLDQRHGGRTYCPVPGSLGGSWSDIDKESFILGLYIFGKNLNQVKRFMESKEMGDIQSFYYGEFYRSDGHRKWSECRKIRSRRCIHGQKIFTAWRQQELLSRLLPRMSEDCQNTLLEVSRTFGEGKISLEEYVSALKATVGMNNLIEAVGIGKGKQDLTGIVMEPLKSNHVIPVRPEIPVGKACSSLTSGDIIKFLTGDFRLSKARSNDLFWEAVWPRLLARGWHSEQPKNYGCAGSKHALVFLIPGVKKFSRRRLVKGNHYFDSVSDVLNKVALDPSLLELEVEAVKSSVQEEYRWDSELKVDQDGFSDRQRHCYLRPRISKCKLELMKFTIVDTSLAYGAEPSKLRELRSIPVNTTNTSIQTNILRDPERDTSEEIVDDPDMAPSNGPLDNHANSYANIEKQQRKTKCQFGQSVKPSQSNHAPVTKRRRLTACNQSETSHSRNSFLVAPVRKQEEPSFQLYSPDANETIVSQVVQSLDKVSSTSSSANSSPDESSEGILKGNGFGELPNEKRQPRTLIDLNLPHVPPDFETDEPFTMEVDSQDDPSTKRTLLPSETGQQLEDSEDMRTSTAEQQPTVNSRRQSTRNRPLTTKALEALACGFLNTKRRKRGAETLSQENIISRPSRRARGRVGVTGNWGVEAGVVDSKVVEMMVDCECSGNTVGKPQVGSEKGTHELLGMTNPTYHPEVLMCKDD